MSASIRDARALHVDDLVRGGDPVPVPAISIDDANAFHARALVDAGVELLAGYGDAAATLTKPVSPAGTAVLGVTFSSSEWPRDAQRRSRSVLKIGPCPKNWAMSDLMAD